MFSAFGANEPHQLSNHWAAFLKNRRLRIIGALKPFNEEREREKEKVWRIQKEKKKTHTHPKWVVLASLGNSSICFIRSCHAFLSFSLRGEPLQATKDYLPQVR